MPFGIKNSSATFQRLINKVIADLEGCEAYIDDVVIYSDTWEEQVKVSVNYSRDGVELSWPPISPKVSLTRHKSLIWGMSLDMVK